MNQLLFRCPKKGKDFDSGFQAGSSDMKALPADAKFRVRCGVCGDMHELRFTDAKLTDHADTPPLR